MNARPDLLIRRMVQRGFTILRQTPHYVTQLLPNLDREAQEQVQTLVREYVVPVVDAPSNAAAPIPAVVVVLRQDRELQGYLGNILDHDTPQELTDAGFATGLAAGVASAGGIAGAGRTLLGPLRVATAGVDGDGVPFVTFAGAPLKPRTLINRNLTLHVTGGPGAGTIRGIVDNTTDKIIPGAAWPAGKTPTADSWVEVRLPSGVYDGEPARVFDGKDPRWFERRGHRRQATIDVEVGAQNREACIGLAQLVVGMFIVSSDALETRGVQNAQIQISDLARRSEFFPDASCVRSIGVTCEYELSVAVALDAADSFAFRLWAPGETDAPNAAATGVLGFQRPTTLP